MHNNSESVYWEYHFLNHRFPPPCPVSMLEHSDTVCVNLGAHPCPDPLCPAAHPASGHRSAFLGDTGTLGTSLGTYVMPESLII